jgi:hypothetical protein
MRIAERHCHPERLCRNRIVTKKTICPICHPEAGEAPAGRSAPKDPLIETGEGRRRKSEELTSLGQWMLPLSCPLESGGPSTVLSPFGASAAQDDRRMTGNSQGAFLHNLSGQTSILARSALDCGGASHRFLRSSPQPSHTKRVSSPQIPVTRTTSSKLVTPSASLRSAD